MSIGPNCRIKWLMASMLFKFPHQLAAFHIPGDIEIAREDHGPRPNVYESCMMLIMICLLIPLSCFSNFCLVKVVSHVHHEFSLLRYVYI